MITNRWTIFLSANKESYKGCELPSYIIDRCPCMCCTSNASLHRFWLILSLLPLLLSALPLCPTPGSRKSLLFVCYCFVTCLLQQWITHLLNESLVHDLLYLQFYMRYTWHGQLDIVDINVILLRKGNKLNSTTEAIGHSSKTVLQYRLVFE